MGRKLLLELTRIFMIAMVVFVFLAPASGIEKLPDSTAWTLFAMVVGGFYVIIKTAGDR